MKLTVALMLLLAATKAAEVKSRIQQKEESSKTDKRELDEGNAGLEKRAPVLPTVPPSPGIEYAESKESEREKSPPQQIYATPVPQIAKISDVLTGQGPFQAAIASHLYAPVSVYQPRLGAPTTYQVSAPIPSQLAYSEHKISYQPPQNAIQYTQPVQYNQKLQTLKQSNFARPINFQQPYQQQIFVQSQQPVVYSHQPQLVQIPQHIFQQIPQIPFQAQRTIQYIQPNAVQPNLVHQPAYNRGQQTLVRLVAPQPGITYANQESSEAQNNDQVQLKSQEQKEEPRALQKQAPSAQKNYNDQPQGAVSYASFSQSQPAPSFTQQPRLHYQSQPQQQQQQPQQQQQQQPQQPQQYQQPQPLYQQQILLRSQPQHQFQIQSHQPQIQLQYEVQPQIQYQNAPAKLSQETIVAASTKSLPVPQVKQVSYLRPGLTVAQLESQQLQPQVYQQGQPILIQNPGHGGPSSLAIAPSFPPVQYFGKFAQAIFGGYQH